MREMTPGDLEAGDEVRVFDVNGRRMGQPDGGWVGEVERVGRKIVYIRYGGMPKPSPFVMATQQSHDKWAHQWFKTVEDAVLDARRGTAVEALRARGITLERHHERTLEQVEALAALVATFPPEED